jgi:cytochrome c peroxidase
MIKKILILFVLLSLFACKDKEYESLEHSFHSIVQLKVDSLNLSLESLENEKDIAILKKNFKNSRKHYKVIEPFVEYYFQGFSRRINGPALPEIKTDDNVVNEPTGFQVIEELIYSDSLDLSQLNKEIKILKADLSFVKQNIKDLPIQNHHFYELIQHQIIRIATLGITGFDSPVAFHSIDEAKYSIEGIQELYLKYCEINNEAINSTFIKLSKEAISYISQNNNFNSFNRLVFIKEHLMPLSVAFEQEFLTVIEKQPNFYDNKVFSGHLADLMQGKKLNPDAFLPFASTKSSPQKIELGKMLFSDASLSKDNSMSCATCHKAELAFTDGLKTSNLNIHSTSIKRNSPTLLYSSFQKSFFYDLRSQDLENQIEDVMKNPEEFNLSPLEIKNRLAKNQSLLQMFTKVFPDVKEITPFEIRNAIASYVRSLMPFESKIDDYFKGKINLSESETNGFNLFSGKAKCATCHFIPLYNGTIPPWYNNSESEVIGVPKNIAWTNATVDSDLGRYTVNQIEQFRFSFKTPTIRNIEKTAPYMHNGVYNTLDEVIRFYELGGGNGIGMALEFQTLPFDNLELSEQDKVDLVSFLKTLTDKK